MTFGPLIGADEDVFFEFGHLGPMEALGRFELPTCGLGNRRSIHLSYRAVSLFYPQIQRKCLMQLPRALKIAVGENRGLASRQAVCCKGSLLDGASKVSSYAAYSSRRALRSPASQSVNATTPTSLPA